MRHPAQGNVRDTIQKISPRGIGSAGERDLDFWLEDENVVAVAHNTACRVHRGVLARRSNVFSGMFAIPRPAASDADGEKVDGCPVVRAQDSVHDFEHLLRAPYDGIDACVMEHERAQFSALMYDMSSILQTAVRRLKMAFTDDFETGRDHETLSAHAVSGLGPVVMEPEEFMEALSRRTGDARGT